MNGPMSSDNAAKQLQDTIKVMQFISRQCFKDLVVELLEVGPEEQNRRFESRRQQSLLETQQRDRDLRQMDVEASIRMGMDPATIDHEACARAAGRG